MAWIVAAGLSMSVIVSLGCGGSDDGLACPLLAPGAVRVFAPSGPLDLTQGEARAAGTVERGQLARHALWLPEGASVRAVAGGHADQLMLYGPRDAFGGYPHCLALAESAVELTTTAAGEYLLLAGASPGTSGGGYTVAVTCAACTAEPACPTLAARGCADVRCDGELNRDAGGCLTCECAAGALCGPERTAGPGGSCVLPACTCEDAAPAVVCGQDGRSWPSACAARCAGVVPLRSGACEVACPDLAACAAPCYGLRAATEDGCPTCACHPGLAPDTASCAACPQSLAPVCGSDGVTYANRCTARCHGARILYAAACVDACRTPPAGCALDCAWGYAAAAEVDGDSCLSCACAPAPSATCAPDGAPVCATLPGLPAPSTVGSPCLAVHLGAQDGVWGPCGEPCVDDTDCAAWPDATCRVGGFLAGRCQRAETASDCGCAAILEPVCGASGSTWDNICTLRCGGDALAHLGACCEDGPVCPASERPRLDARGCPAGCTGDAPAGTCADGAPTLPACSRDGTLLTQTACRAHLDGAAASPAWCTR